MNYDVQIGDRTYKIAIRRNAPAGSWLLSVDGGPEETIDGRFLGDAELLRRDGDAWKSVGVAVVGDHVDVQIAGYPIRAKVTDPRRGALTLGAAGAQGAMKSDMPGLVVRLVVAQGASVKRGQPVIVIEAMKMENELKAPIDGRVETIHVAPGARVETGAILVTLVPE